MNMHYIADRPSILAFFLFITAGMAAMNACFTDFGRGPRLRCLLDSVVKHNTTRLAHDGFSSWTL